MEKFPTTETVRDFAFDGKGRVYTAGTKQLGVIDGGTWQKMYDLAGTPHEGVISNPVFGSIAVIGKQLVATHTYGSSSSTAQAWSRSTARPWTRHCLGGRCSEAIRQRAQRQHHPHAARRRPRQARDHWQPRRGYSVTFHARGRAWVSGSSSELSLVMSMCHHHVASSTIPEITSTIHAVYVVWRPARTRCPARPRSPKARSAVA